MTNSLDPPKVKLKFEERKSFPVMTFGLIVVVVAVYCLGASSKVDTWFVQNTIQPEQFWQSCLKGDYQSVLTGLTMSNFATVSLWTMIPSIYFIWLFGTSVELRLGPTRFLVLFLLGATIPWAVQIWDALFMPNWPLSESGAKFTLNYFGPGLFSFALFGAYMVLVPAKKVAIGGGMPKQRGEIFSKEVQVPLNERFGLKPWTFMSAFVVYQLGLHYVTRTLWHGYDTLGLYAPLIAVGLGYGMATTLLNAAMQTFQDSSMKLEAIRRYNELVDLDVSPDDAIRGTARAMGLPIEQVRDWVLKNKGRLRIT
jgi:membrane associated rhomboid family serine protease